MTDLPLWKNTRHSKIIFWLDCGLEVFIVSQKTVNRHISTVFSRRAFRVRGPLPKNLKGEKRGEFEVLSYLRSRFSLQAVNI